MGSSIYYVITEGGGVDPMMTSDDKGEGGEFIALMTSSRKNNFVPLFKSPLFFVKLSSRYWRWCSMPKYWDCKFRSFRTEELCRGWQGPSRNKSAVEIDNYSVVATYCPPAINTDTVTSHAAASQQWRTAHVRESQYCLQLVRCNDHLCCTPWRSPL